MSDRILAFLDEGIVGFAAVAFGLIVVVPMLPFIAIGWLFSRAAQGIEARQGGDANAAPSRSDESPVANGDAPKPRSKAHRLAERAMRHG